MHFEQRLGPFTVSGLSANSSPRNGLGLAKKLDMIRSWLSIVAKRKGKRAEYERSFEDLLRKNQILYLSIDEGKRPKFRGTTVKNFDFIVISFKGRFLIDVKGKRLCYGERAGNARLENWVRRDDINGLMEWSSHFSGFVPLLLFVYKIERPSDKRLFEDLSSATGVEYGFAAVELATYYTSAVQRSSSFDAISVHQEAFKKISRPLSYFIPEVGRKW